MYLDVLYGRIGSLLSTHASILAFGLTADAIRPSYDPKNLPHKTFIVYSFSSFAFDLRSKKGSGTLDIQVADPQDKIRAGRIMEAVRALLTARNLSATPVLVGLVRETPSRGDGMMDQEDRRVCRSSFSIVFRFK